MPAEDTPRVAARRERLRSWIRDRFESSRKAFLEDAAARGYKLDGTEISNLQTGKKSFGENKADEVELAAGMPDGYLFNPLGQGGSLPVRLNPAKIVTSITALLQFLRRRDHDASLDLTSADDAELFASVYALAVALPATPTPTDEEEFSSKVESLVEARERKNERIRGQQAGGDPGEEAGVEVPRKKARTARRQG